MAVGDERNNERNERHGRRCGPFATGRRELAFSGMERQTASDAERGDPEFGCGLGGLGGSSCVRTAVAETGIPEGHPGRNETLGKRQRADGPQIRAVETGWVDEETEV